MPNTAEIEAILQAGVASGEIPGVAAAFVTPQQPAFAAGYGTRDLATGAPMQADTVIWIASLTKAITGACALQLVEQGRLALDEPIGGLLPEVGRAQVMQGLDNDGRPKLRAPRRPITLRHLLSHTSGYVYEIWNEEMRAYMQGAGVPSIISGMNAPLAVPLMFDPGERWEYGIGIDWAGKAVEAASGQTLGAYMAEHIFQPLGMADTTFLLSPAHRTRLAKIHVRTPDGLVSTDTEMPQQPQFESGGGGLYSTVGDYLKFAEMILQGGMCAAGPVLQPATVALMAENAIGDNRVSKLKAAIALYSNDVASYEGMQWGLTFMLNPQPLPTGRSAGSLAWAGLANCYYWIDPARQIAGVFATQILPFYDAAALRLYNDFECAVYRGCVT